MPRLSVRKVRKAAVSGYTPLTRLTRFILSESDEEGSRPVDPCCRKSKAPQLDNPAVAL